MRGITRAAVIGAGTMGSGIAATIANTGVQVALVDLGDFAHTALERMTKQQPSPLVTRGAAKRITTGSLDNGGLGLVADADWIVEAVIEDVEVKRDLYRRLDEVRKPGSFVTSNTSTIPISELLVGAPDRLVPDFAVTHFFNPPRTMRLLELASGEWTRPEAVETLAEFADVVLGKTVVRCKDTPAFIANRLGCFWLSCAIAEAVERGLTVEEADTVMSRPFGIPKTAVFGLMDLIGIPLYVHITKSLDRLLPEGDPWHALPHKTDLLERMVEKGFTGRAGGGGFTKLDRSAGAKTLYTLDLEPLEYRVAETPKLDLGGGLRELLERDDRYGEFAFAVAAQTLAYSASLVPEVSDSVSQIDLAMQLGFGWKHGPFALVDQLGAGWLADRLEAAGSPVPDVLAQAARKGSFFVHSGDGRRELGADGSLREIRRAPGILLLSDVKRAGESLVANDAASVWDVGDGVACLEIHTKLNVLDLPVFEVIEGAVELVGAQLQALVIHAEADHFSAGANLKRIHELIEAGKLDEVEHLLRTGQRAFELLKRARFPVVGAPHGLCLGGGCEILLHCDGVQAHTETWMGLVEPRVGIVPGWGGCKEMLLRATANPSAAQARRSRPGAEVAAPPAPERKPGGPMPPVRQVFDLIAATTTSTSADHARELGFLRAHDRVTRNRDRLLADAKAFALELADGYVPPEPVALRLPGPSGAATLKLDVDTRALAGGISEHDRRIAGGLARVLTGGDADIVEPVSEEDILALETEVNLALLETKPSVERIAHMLATGKPLRN
jgi:3-hydroxyacyl-CoA dehydrogenase